MIEAYLRANKMFVDYKEVSFAHYFSYFCYECPPAGHLIFRRTCSGVLMSGHVFDAQPQQDRVYSSYLQLDLADVEPCISGPKRYVVAALSISSLPFIFRFLDSGFNVL